MTTIANSGKVTIVGGPGGRAGLTIQAPTYVPAAPAHANLLVTNNQATANSGRVSGWGFGGGQDVLLSATSANVLEGPYSFDLMRGAAGYMVTSPPAGPVVPGGTYTLMMTVFAPVAGMTAQIGFTPLTVDGVTVVATSWGTTYNLTAGQWNPVRRLITLTTDPTIARLQVLPVIGPANAHAQIDRIGVMVGDAPSTEWSLPYASRPPEVWTDNLLTQDQATLETSAAGWINGGGGTQTYAITTAQAREGSASMLVTYTGAVVATPVQITNPRTPMAAGQVVTGMVSLRSDFVRRLYAQLWAYDSAGVRVGTWAPTADVWASDLQWHDLWLQGITPAGTATVLLRTAVWTVNPNETFYLDRAGIFLGDVRTWTAPDTPNPAEVAA